MSSLVVAEQQRDGAVLRCLDCVAIAPMCAVVVARGSDLAVVAAALCAAACERCAEACERETESAWRHCADVCQEAALRCRQYGAICEALHATA